MMRKTRQGFTLLEVLIAAALGTVVLGLTIKAFSEFNKVANVQRSKAETQSMATEGLQKLSTLAKKSSIFFYSARPLDDPGGTVPTGRAASPARRLAIPALLAGGANPGSTRRPPGDALQQTDITRWSAATTSRTAFRFTDALDGGQAGLRLRSAAGRNGGNAYEDFFPGPLAYFAEANFVPVVTGTAATAGEANKAQALLPRTWTFYVLYLAPMSLDDGDANTLMPGSSRDELPPPHTSPNHKRTAIPYELRMMTIPGVWAGDPSPSGGYTSSPVGMGGDTTAYDATSGRVLAPMVPIPPPPDEVSFLDPPYDYDGRLAGGGPNYDPICIPTAGGMGKFLDAALPENNYRFRPPAAAAYLARPASGPRMLGGTLHANFNMLGNDPPTDQALQQRDPAAPTISDRQLIAYIDPDTVDGTCMRFVNNMREAPAGAADGFGRIRIPASGNPYRKYLNMYGSDCAFFENRYMDEWNEPAAASTATGAYGVLPARAYIAVSIRYRNRKDLPFQFTTVHTEIDLDGVTTFAKIRPRR